MTRIKIKDMCGKKKFAKIRATFTQRDFLS